MFFMFGISVSAQTNAAAPTEAEYGTLIDVEYGVEEDGTAYEQRTYVKYDSNVLTPFSAASSGSGTYTATKKSGDLEYSASGYFTWDSYYYSCTVSNGTGSIIYFRPGVRSAIKPLLQTHSLIIAVQS